ncbi:excinuclease ABC subunit UvrC [Alphaproteobacteria bacterium]|nr:excinuclease ABC subunit UvrC [Alphaproteobacteria bacterium]MDB3974291.1 excinuclease ABC subunit UvrC [Alphaproteobacteria bacterium]
MIGLEVLKNKIKEAPKTSGVYLFKNKKDIPIYIGKAINIKRRLSNYGNLPKLPRRLQKMVSQTVNIDFELTESERNALLLEALLIKKFSPRYNIRLKDDKSFPLIKITDGQFPRLTRFRNDFHQDDRVFGPFTSALKTDKVIKILQKSFKLRSCTDLEFKNRKRPCLLFDLKQCSAPCVKYVSQKDYEKQVGDTIKFFQGSQKSIFDKLEKQMIFFSKNENYEKAAEVRDSIQSLNYIIREEIKVGNQDANYDYIYINDKGYFSIFIGFIRYGRYLGGNLIYYSEKVEDDIDATSLIIQFYLKSFRPNKIILSKKIIGYLQLKSIMNENYKIETSLRNNTIPGIRQISKLTLNKNDKEVLLQKQKYQSSKEILELLKYRFGISHSIERIEAYDNSFFGNNYAVSSYVVFNEDGFSIKDSRTYKFKDYDLKKFGDADLMRKVFEARFSKDDKVLPDIMIIDGGMPYLKICKEIIEKNGIKEDIFLIGVSKGFKRDFRFDRYHTSKERNISLREVPQIEGFIQKMRDKAHNLSKKNSMKRMSDSLKTSFLDGIAGIGKIKKMRVINFFGNVQNLKQSTRDELIQIKGLNSKNIQDILDKING